ncbi:hypothetical protein [Micromonospora sp. NPDC001898]|uniref:hypothetical protein n=1 Tax=Micromonospora sp. NPDC001898 TaxID=3364221 RepID=UPI00368789C4
MHQSPTTLTRPPLRARFAGWSMPLRDGSETSVRERAGLFDLSHMGQIGVRGPMAPAVPDHTLVGHLSAVPVGRARNTMPCADSGGALDDLVAYRLAADTAPADRDGPAPRRRRTGARPAGRPGPGAHRTGGDRPLPSYRRLR